MLKILDESIDGNVKITRFTRDGDAVSHTIKTPIQAESSKQAETKSTIYEQIYAENLYQSALIEMQMLGGI